MYNPAFFSIWQESKDARKECREQEAEESYRVSKESGWQEIHVEKVRFQET
jgi:hypothetical protein